jgi:hypothetical protein
VLQAERLGGLDALDERIDAEWCAAGLSGPRIRQRALIVEAGTQTLQSDRLVSG